MLYSVSIISLSENCTLTPSPKATHKPPLQNNFPQSPPKSEKNNQPLHNHQKRVLPASPSAPIHHCSTQINTTVHLHFAVKRLLRHDALSLTILFLDSSMSLAATKMMSSIRFCSRMMDRELRPCPILLRRGSRESNSLTRRSPTLSSSARRLPKRRCQTRSSVLASTCPTTCWKSTSTERSGARPASFPTTTCPWIPRRPFSTTRRK